MMRSLFFGQKIAWKLPQPMETPTASSIAIWKAPSVMLYLADQRCGIIYIYIYMYSKTKYPVLYTLWIMFFMDCILL